MYTRARMSIKTSLKCTARRSLMSALLACDYESARRRSKLYLSSWKTPDGADFLKLVYGFGMLIVF